MDQKQNSTLNDEITSDDSDLIQYQPIRWNGLVLGMGIGVLLTVGAFYYYGQSDNTQSTPPPVIPKAFAQNVTPSPKPDKNPAPKTSDFKPPRPSIKLTGTVVPRYLLPVLSKINGLQVQKVFVEEGTFVAKNQIIAQLDDQIIRTQIEQAEAQILSAIAAIKQAEAQVKQAEFGQEEVAIAVEQSQATVIQRQALLEQTKAGVSQAFADVERAKAEISLSQAGIAQEKAALEEAVREKARSQKLVESGVISRQDLDLKETIVKSAQENLNKAQHNLNKAYQELNKAQQGVTVAQTRVKTAESELITAQAGVRGSQAKVNTAGSNILSAKAAFVNATANLRNNQARLEQLMVQLEQTKVRAPDGGVVAERMVQVGDITSGTQKLFTIIQGNELELALKVPETLISKIQIGMELKLTSNSDRRIKLTGTVREILPMVDPKNRQATVKVALPSDNRVLQSGILLTTSLPSNKKP